MTREIILDTETTGLFVDEGHRLISVGMVEMINGLETGVKLHFICNPERDSTPEALKVHQLTTEHLSSFPLFQQYAEAIREFIGDDPVVITCWTMDKNGTPYTLDQAFLDAELEKAGQPALKPTQWLNVRRWGEEMYGHKQASLNPMLDRFGISHEERDAVGHGALRDAELLALLYPKLKLAYANYKEKNKQQSLFFNSAPPQL